MNGQCPVAQRLPGSGEPCARQTHLARSLWVLLLSLADEVITSWAFLPKSKPAVFLGIQQTGPKGFVTQPLLPLLWRGWIPVIHPRSCPSILFPHFSVPIVGNTWGLVFFPCSSLQIPKNPQEGRCAPPPGEEPDFGMFDGFGPVAFPSGLLHVCPWQVQPVPSAWSPQCSGK